MANAGAAVDADATCEEVGVTVLPETKEGEKSAGRRLVPVKPVDIQVLDPGRYGKLSTPPPTSRPPGDGVEPEPQPGSKPDEPEQE